MSRTRQLAIGHSSLSTIQRWDTCLLPREAPVCPGGAHAETPIENDIHSKGNGLHLDFAQFSVFDIDYEALGYVFADSLLATRFVRRHPKTLQ